MLTEYRDAEGILHNLDMNEGSFKGKTFFRVSCNGMQTFDLTLKEDGTWEELFAGPTPKASEYGQLIETLRF